MTLRQHRKKYDVVNAHTFMLSIALYIVLYIALNFIFFFLKDSNNISSNSKPSWQSKVSQI